MAGGRDLKKAERQQQWWQWQQVVPVSDQSCKQLAQQAGVGVKCMYGAWKWVEGEAGGEDRNHILYCET